jgi:hypothetical protein
VFALVEDTRNATGEDAIAVRLSRDTLGRGHRRAGGTAVCPMVISPADAREARSISGPSVSGVIVTFDLDRGIAAARG